MTDWNWHLIVSLPSNQETVSSDIDVLFFYFYFQNKTKIMVSLKKEKPSEKSYIVEEELDCADIDDTEDLPRLVFIDEQCENLIAVNEGKECSRSRNQKKKSGVWNVDNC